MLMKVISELEAVNIKLEGINSIARAVEDAMIYSPNNAAEYAGAVGIISALITESKNKMCAVIDAGFYDLQVEAET